MTANTNFLNATMRPLFQWKQEIFKQDYQSVN